MLRKGSKECGSTAPTETNGQRQGLWKDSPSIDSTGSGVVVFDKDLLIDADKSDLLSFLMYLDVLCCL